MKKTLSIFIAAICGITLVFAQEGKTKMELLEANMWCSDRIQPTESEELPLGFYWIYKDNKLTLIDVSFDDGIKNKSQNTVPFYLSDTPDEVFDPDKVGKSLDGKYLVFLADLSALRAALTALIDKKPERFNTTEELTLDDIRSRDQKDFMVLCYQIVSIDDTRLRIREVKRHTSDPSIIMERYVYKKLE